MNVRGGRGGPGAGEECDEDDEEDDEEREGVAPAFQVSRLPPISGCVPETSRRKVKKKKKKKKSPATGLGKGSGRGDGSCKEPSSKLESNKELKREKEENKHLSYSSSANAAFSSAVDESLSTKINESLRWEGVLEDPVAEEERIRIYKLNRRKRYRLSALEGFCPTPSVPEGANEKVSVLPDSESHTNSKQQAVKVDCINYFLDGNMTSKILPSPELATTNVPEQKLPSALANLS
ncbi:protein LIAT1 isoform X1 [Dromiciops gliroides]|uniref:protein LIAT1 isoform X1 n=1 Tax=Dromiciops gliroides TaxID=33562 RepID=UPI001CC7EC5F|nr:protein LIAT1 isoform X1 [Dromiciops gliroides]